MQNISQLDLIPVSEAVLCMDCERISRQSGHECAGCGSTSVLNLAAILAKEESCGTKY